VQPSILVSESLHFSDAATNRLRAAGRVTLADLDRVGLLSSVRDVDALWVRLRHTIDAEVMDRAPRLRLIATPTTGLNHVDLDEAARRGIRVISLRGETDFLDSIHATSEHTLALILALLRHVPAATLHVTEGGWNRDLFRGRELHGKTAGVVGYGRIGRMVAVCLQALGMKVVATDPAVNHATSGSVPGDTASNIELVPLATLLARADLVTLHVALSEKTRDFFGASEFARMKPGAWFINTSRGELIDEEALLQALLDGRIAGAALDVLRGENSSGMSAHPLVHYAGTHENLLITPHVGGCTSESMQATEEFLAEKVVAALTSLAEEACVETSRTDGAR
jgi:D-3-phosphoglycerate dehydrogenase / 2-oxoglutarate reductase